jgi:hypothetical protein
MENTIGVQNVKMEEWAKKYTVTEGEEFCW